MSNKCVNFFCIFRNAISIELLRLIKFFKYYHRDHTLLLFDISFLPSLLVRRGFVMSGIKPANIHSAISDFGACLEPAIEAISSLCASRVDCSRILSPSPDPTGISSRRFISLSSRSWSFFFDISPYSLREVTLKAFLPPSLSILSSASSSSSARRAFERELWPLLEFFIVRQLANGVGWSGRLSLLFFPRRSLIHSSRKSATQPNALRSCPSWSSSRHYTLGLSSAFRFYVQLAASQRGCTLYSKRYR